MLSSLRNIWHQLRGHAEESASSCRRAPKADAVFIGSGKVPFQGAEFE